MTRKKPTCVRKEKKILELKTHEERLAAIANIKTNLSQMGVGLVEFEGLSRFRSALEEYGKEVFEHGICGKYFVPEIKRYIEYILPARNDAREVVKLTIL